MLEFSILVPAFGTEQQVDDTLVSVLENRPSGCEVLVVCGPDYRDPYELGDELTFITATQDGPWTRLANLGLAHVRSRFVHVILPGVLASSGWLDPIRRAFDESKGQPMAVVPAIQEGTNTVISVSGVTRTWGGSPRYVGTPPRSRSATFFPTRFAGFFRTKKLLELGGWNEHIHPHLADFELALRARDRGFRAVSQPAIRLIRSYGEAGVRGEQNSFAYVRDLGKIRKRYMKSERMPSFSVFGDLLVAMASLDPGRFAGHVAGTFAAAVDSPPPIQEHKGTRTQAA